MQTSNRPSNRSARWVIVAKARFDRTAAAAGVPCHSAGSVSPKGALDAQSGTLRQLDTHIMPTTTIISRIPPALTRLVHP